MSPVERIQAAVSKLERLVDEIADTREVSAEALKTALLMVVPVAKILRNDVALLTSDMSDEKRARVDLALVRSGDLDLVDAILRGDA